MLYAYARPRYQVSVYRTIGPLVSRYLKNEWTEFNQILYTHYQGQDLHFNS